MSKSFALNTAGVRIRTYRKSTGMSQQKLATLLGFSQGYIGDIEAGRSEPSFNFLSALTENTNVSSDWILTGKGEMYRQADAENDAADREDAMLLEMIKALPPAEKSTAVSLLKSQFSAFEQKKQLEALIKEVEALRQKAG
jgi:transcriptional regulator with XRE-family HTH domain